MELTATDFYRLQPLYPQKQFEREGEPLYIACQRQKDAMRLHLARERYADIKPLWSAILTLLRGNFTFREMAIVLETDLATIETEYERMQQNAR